jgi:hypothetical protein
MWRNRADANRRLEKDDVPKALQAHNDLRQARAAKGVDNMTG